MPCVIEEEVFDELKEVLKPKFFGYTGFTGYNGIKGYTGFTGYGEPTEYTNSSDKPYYYPSKDTLEAASEELAKIKYNERKNGLYHGVSDYKESLKKAIKPVIRYTGSSIDDDTLAKEYLKRFEMPFEKPKSTLWQAIQIMIFDYICSINNRYDLNIPLDIVG